MLSSRRVPFIIALLGLWAGASGCKFTCENAFDCGEEGYCSPDTNRCTVDCFEDDHCRNPVGCAEGACPPMGNFCNTFERCVTELPPDRTGTTTGGPMPPPNEYEGYDAAVGDAKAFVVSALNIAPAEVGFDIDADGDADNVLGRLGAAASDQVNAAVRSGDGLILLELAGLDEDYSGEDESLTVRIYAGRDNDDPPYPADNFTIPPGASSCCAFQVRPGALSADGQSTARSPAVIEAGRLRSLVPVDASLVMSLGDPPATEIQLGKLRLTARLPGDLSELDEGVIGAAIRAATLARVDCPARWCTTTGGGTLLEFASITVGPFPDIDLDGDGLECSSIGLAGTLQSCHDGVPVEQAAGSCTGEIIPAGDPALPITCAQDTRFADGYSVALEFSAIPARILAN